ncbi:MAG: MFS transporter [Pirellulaceae bacterium]|nr:MFS transporter [Pirellulaceae bacterium]
MNENPYKSPQVAAEPAGFRDMDPFAQPTWVRWQMIAILMGFAGLNHFHRQSLPAAVSVIMPDCGFSETDMGWVYFAFLLAYVLFMIPGGWLADWLGGKRTLIVSGLGTAALVAATGLCGTIAIPALAFAAILLVRFPMGMLTTPLFPAAGRIAQAWIPFGSRGWANGLVLGATTIGVAAAPIVFGFLSDVLSWQLACVLMGVITALVTCLWAIYGRNSPAEHPQVNAAERELIGPVQESARPPSAGDFATMLMNPSLLLLTASYAAVGYYEYTLFYWMKFYFSDVLDYPEQTSRYFTTLVSLAMVGAMPLGGFLSDVLVRAWGYRWGRAAVPIFGLLASAILLYVATRVQGQLAVVSLFFLAHFAIGLCEAPTWVAGLEIGGKSCGTSAAIVNMGGNLGGLFAPVVTVYVAGQYGWNAGFLVASLACLLGVVLWLGIRLKHPTTGAAP